MAPIYSSTSSSEYGPGKLEAAKASMKGQLVQLIKPTGANFKFGIEPNSMRIKSEAQSNYR
jgi:hypothetical protein